MPQVLCSARSQRGTLPAKKIQRVFSFFLKICNQDELQYFPKIWDDLWDKNCPPLQGIFLMVTNIIALRSTWLKNIFLCSILVWGFAGYGQNGTISGSVMDSLSHKPVEYASVSLLSDKTNKTVTGVVTD